MKTFQRIIGVIIVILLLTQLWTFLFWYFTPKKVLNVLIVDKTILNTKTQEHVSINWILKHDKYVNSQTGPYDHKINYYGFFPDDKGLFEIKDFNKWSIPSLDSLANSYKVVYYTDMYGIYDGEWYHAYPKVSPYGKESIDNSMEHTRRIYGGMTPNEMYVLKKMKAQKKLILTEFNIIASPTPSSVRYEFEKEFDLHWSGWVGRYYDQLDTSINKEMPRWMKRGYLAQHQNNWPFKKSGIVFVRNDDRIEILENNTHLSIPTPIMHTSKKYMKKYGLPAQMKYSFWFDIIQTSSKNAIVSTYVITPNAYGKRLLKSWGIPEFFPSVIEHDSSDYKFHYFAGDFCDNPISMTSSRFKWIEHYNVLSYEQGSQERVSFFWKFYRPMVRKILSNYYDEIK